VALGARSAGIVTLVLREGLRLVVIGLALGVAGALAAVRLLSSYLYGVSATDIATFSAITPSLPAWHSSLVPFPHGARYASILFESSGTSSDLRAVTNDLRYARSMRDASPRDKTRSAVRFTATDIVIANDFDGAIAKNVRPFLMLATLDSCTTSSVSSSLRWA
jgi:hypothetical protein